MIFKGGVTRTCCHVFRVLAQAVVCGCRSSERYIRYPSFGWRYRLLVGRVREVVGTGRSQRNSQPPCNGYLL
jgi:hypothetical protein